MRTSVDLVPGVGDGDADQHTALNGSMHQLDESDDEEDEDDLGSEEDDDGDTRMAGDASAAPKTAALEQHLGEGVGWVEEDDLQAAPATAEGTF